MEKEQIVTNLKDFSRQKRGVFSNILTLILAKKKI